MVFLGSGDSSGDKTIIWNSENQRDLEIQYCCCSFCTVVAERCLLCGGWNVMWSVVMPREWPLYVLLLKSIESLLPHSVGAGLGSHWQIAFCSCCDLWRYSEVILTGHQRAAGNPFAFLQGHPYKCCAVRGTDLLAYTYLLLNIWRGKLMGSVVPSWKIIALPLDCYNSIQVISALSWYGTVRRVHIFLLFKHCYGDYIRM